jgi:ABC-type multidrug transport system fused ATPase/permease subunit
MAVQREDGVIVEQGSHHDLIGGDTLYRWMYESQWKDDSSGVYRS